MDELIDFFHTIGKLKQTKREGWVKMGISDVESVADHSFRTAVMTMILAKKYGLDELKCIKMALLSDLAESVIGDLITERGKEEIASVDEKFEKERNAMKELLAPLDDSDELIALWEESERPTTPEGRFVKAMDKLEMAFQADEYKDPNNPDKLNEFFENADKYMENEELKKIKEILDSLKGLS
ncbi:MAG: HD domain-containing protein [Nanoarchaeota archaeon]|nr:HD domain-containing protein [Nanoarchaeota archaeon]